ncbi:FAD-binding oxidoreductase [Porphyrobacter sp. ULC335]|nr:FAD-binding oxidoreductase [Porphyrobacter sp. ULC335]
MRRQLLEGMAVLPLALNSPLALAQPAISQTSWASGRAWNRLRVALGEKLFPVVLPDLAGEAGKRLLSNPVAVGDEAGLTQSSGWIDAWQSAPSAYAARVRDAQDVARIVRFAREKGVRLVIRGGGHSYHGTSCAPDSLMLWTRGLDGIELHDAFVPAGSEAAPVPAVSLGAGCIWGAAYDAVTRQHGRYVQGGGCTTVGVAGLIQGGGFGNFSKAYGMAAASLLEAEVVTADGAIRIVNAARDPDLFWALKGGGGGTFGVVTRVTLRTHDLPSTFGAIRFTIQARNEKAFRGLIDRFLVHYRDRLFNPHWGEQAIFTRSRKLIGEMVFQGLREEEVRAHWADFMDFAASDQEAFELVDPLTIFITPARLFWDPDNMNRLIPGVMTSDTRSDVGASAFWWTGDGEQAGQLHHGMQSMWLSQKLLESDARVSLVDALFAASRIWSVSLHFNKGIAGGSEFARAASAETAINPDAVDAFCLALIASSGSSSYPGVLPRPDLDGARQDAVAVKGAMQALRKVSPEAGSYLYESDFHLADAGNRYWGKHAERLRQLKLQYDPTGLFSVHHGTGS